MQLLDPKNDVVFKLLFAHPSHRDILIALLSAVLQPTVPITEATVLNPEVPKDLPDDKGAVLDIHVQLADGRHIDVEMQAAVHAGLIRRILYYWARLYGWQLSPGETYAQLCPCVSIVFLNACLLPAARFHGTFRVQEIHDHFELTDALELHLIELPKLRKQNSEPRLARWVQFLLAKNESELQELAMSNAEMLRAKQALDQLSHDPAARELARQRELAGVNLAIIRGHEREEGRAEGLRQAIESICEILQIELSHEHRQLLGQLNADGLQELLERVRRERAWIDTE